MHLTRLIPAFLALILSTPVYAQAWSEFVERNERFTVNFPGDPKQEAAMFTTGRGTSLPSRVYTASDRRGTYQVTVVNYSSATDQLPMAIEDASAIERKKGDTRYDAPGDVDRIRSQRLSVFAGDRRILSEILVHENRLYILEANVAENAPPPAQFQASVQILDADGVRIRYNQDRVTRQR